MNYPLISEYIESIKTPEENFEQLKHLSPVLEEDGEPVMSSGNFAVVFKLKDKVTGKHHAIKCFLKEQEGRAEAYRQIAEELEYVSSTFLTPIKYLEKELFVDSNNSKETEFPVLLMDWVEGQTLDKYIREHIDDEYELSLLAYQFSRLAMWLMSQPFAHGDLKPDNILVKEDGTLVLVDYDGMYVPAMRGQKARELGSPDFRHPARTLNDFDEHIDDFSLSSILLSLKAISLQPDLLENYGAKDRLLFSEKDYRNISNCDLLKEIFPSDDSDLNILHSLFIIALGKTTLTEVSFKLFNLSRPKEPEYENLSTEVTEEDLANAWTDEYGVKYSSDRKRLLRFPMSLDLQSYSILPSCLAIGDYAFEGDVFHDPEFGSYYIGNQLKNLILSNRLEEIGVSSLEGCRKLSSIKLPKSLQKIDDNALNGCHSIQSLTLPSKLKHLGKDALPRDLKKIISLSFSFKVYGECLFGEKHELLWLSPSITKLTLPSEIMYRGRKCYTYDSCIVSTDGILIWTIHNIQYFDMPPIVTTIGNGAFTYNVKIESLYIPEGVSVIENGAFFYNQSLNDIWLPSTITSIGDLKTRQDSVSKYIEFFYPDNIHIPKGMKRHFLDLLPGVHESSLIDDYK